MIDQATGNLVGAIPWHDDVLCYVVTPSGHMGAYRAGEPIAVMPDIRAAIEADIRHNQDKEGV